MLRTLSRMPRFTRVLLIVVLMLPIIWLVVARDTGEALRLWGLVAAISIVPGLVVERLYPRATAGNVYERAHPAHGRAAVLEIGVAIAVGVVYIVVLALLD